jgi:tetratricopeptide (TPR) repeat protein
MIYFPVKCLVLIILGWLWLSQSSFAQEQKVDSLKVMLAKADVDTTKIGLLNKLSETLCMTNPKQALEYSEEAIKLAKNSDLNQGLMDAFDNSGKALYAAELLDLSCQKFDELLNVAKKQGDQKKISFALFNLGTIRMILGQFDKAKELQKEAFLKLTKYYELKKESIPPSEIIIPFYSNLAYILLAKDSAASALISADKGIEFARKEKEPLNNLSRLLALKGEILIKEQKFREAMDVVNESLQIGIKENNMTGQSLALLSIGKIYNSLKEPKNALKAFNKGYNLAVKFKNLELTNLNAEQLHEQYIKLGVSDSALKYLNISKEASSKLKFNETSEELARQEVAAFYKSKSEEKTSKNQHAKQSYFLIIILFIGLTGFFVISYFIFKQKFRFTLNNREEMEDDLHQLEIEKIDMVKRLVAKRKDLATHAIIDIQKNEVLGNVVDKLRTQLNNVADTEKEVISQIIRDLSLLRDQRSWEEFKMRFKRVHPDFSTKLQEVHPDLTLNERRLCVFLHLNMSTKEISATTGQSTISIEMSRTRLRRKLHLTNSSKSLVEFLASL